MPVAAASPRIPNDDYQTPAYRKLVVYAFDPTLGRKLNNHMTVRVPYEPLLPGPRGKKIEIIDYDASNRRYYKAVDLDDWRVVMTDGLTPSEADPRFHQQMAYAVVRNTIDQFEFALGRDVRWHRALPGPEGGPARRRRAPLRVFPHAFQQANAFYDPERQALMFGYFRASAEDAGDNLPGQAVFTCLSHDIIVHETTHAVLDTVRPYFTHQGSGPDTAAFHEAFADIVALFQHFMMRDAVIDTIRRSGGVLHRRELAPDWQPRGETVIDAERAEPNPLVELARQFGHAIGTRSALRSALGTPPDPGLMQKVFEPHHRGALLVAAVFDAYFSIYVKRTADLMRIGRAGGALNERGDVHPDLAERLTIEATKAARHFLGICIRAIDYLPPLDVEFGEFLRAVVTVDSDTVPEDPWGYRAELVKAFRLRGIVPGGVISYSEDALRWGGPATALPPCEGLDFHRLGADIGAIDPRVGLKETLRTQPTNAAKQQAQFLYRYAMDNTAALRLSTAADAKLYVNGFHPIYRIGPNGRLHIEGIAQFMQKRNVDAGPDAPGETMPARGGSTVIFAADGTVKYVIHKSVDSAERIARRREYRHQINAAAPYLIEALAAGINFSALHRGV